MRYLDLSHTIESEMPVYPGDSSVELTQTAFVENDGCSVHVWKTGLHVGTHLDAPFHMILGGKKVFDYPVEQFFGRGQLVDGRNQESLHPGLLEKCAIQKNDIVLVRTDWSKRFGAASYYQDFPEVTTDFANKLVDLGVKILGLDTPSPDRAPYSIHKLLLGHDILIIENLTNLGSLSSAHEFFVTALPLKLPADGSPVRVVAGVRKD